MKQRHRSSITGRFVAAVQALAAPETTVAETTRNGSPSPIRTIYSIAEPLQPGDNAVLNRAGYLVRRGSDKDDTL